MTDSVTYTRTDAVSTISMDDGRVNVFSIPVLRSLHQAFDRGESDHTVILLKGRPGCFTAGFDQNAERSTSGRRHPLEARSDVG